jgi:hypothetical protein
MPLVGGSEHLVRLNDRLIEGFVQRSSQLPSGEVAKARRNLTPVRELAAVEGPDLFERPDPCRRDTTAGRGTTSRGPAATPSHER